MLNEAHIPNRTSPGERYTQVIAAAAAAADGVWSTELPTDYEDSIGTLARHLQKAFSRAHYFEEKFSSVLGTVGQDNGSEERTHALERSNARLEYLIANTPAIIYSSVPTGDFKLTFVSENSLRMLGYEPAEMLNDPNFWFNHIHPDDKPSIFSSLAMVFVEGQRSYEYRFQAKDGRYVWMQDTLRLIRDSNGEPLEVIGSLTDITVRKEMEDDLRAKSAEQQCLIDRLKEAQAQLLQSEKMASIGQLAAGVAHEINNPIGFVNSNMGSLTRYTQTMIQVTDELYQAIKEGGNADSITRADALIKQKRLKNVREDLQDLIKESMDGLARVRDIVQSLKDFSHVGETEWQFSDLHKGIDSTLNIAANEIKYKANVIKELGDLPMVECVMSQLNQVFMNLIVNAAQAIPEHGTIRISSGQQNQRVWIRIADNGSGIPENIRNRIFEPFFTTKPIGQGTGLGLSLSYNIVANHGGTIELDSELGVGTTFTIWLPIEQARRDASSSAAVEAMAL